MFSLTSRKAVRIFELNHKIPQFLWKKILKDAFYTPSSFNLQPWYLVIIESKEGKQKLKPCLKGNLSQLETSSAMVLIFGNDKKKEDKEKNLKIKIQNNQLSEEFENLFMQKKYFQQMQDTYNEMNLNLIQKEVCFECGLLAMQFMQVAEFYGYNTCPIGGFKSEILNSTFDIDSKYFPVIIIAIGKKKKNYQENLSFRFSYKEKTIFI